MAANPYPTMSKEQKEQYLANYNFMHCDDSCKYEKMAKIGQGTFG